MSLSKTAIAAALRAAAESLEESSKLDEAPEETRAPHQSQTTLKAVRRARKLVAPAGQADDLAQHRAKQLLREHGLREVDE
jgi:hypothetical protein